MLHSFFLRELGDSVLKKEESKLILKEYCDFNYLLLLKW